MFCTNCGGKLPEGVRFCIHCGTPVEAPSVPEAPVPPVDIPAPQTSLDPQPVYTDIPQEEPVFEAPAAQEPVLAAPVEEAPVTPAPEEPAFDPYLNDEPTMVFTGAPIYSAPKEPAYASPAPESAYAPAPEPARFTEPEIPVYSDAPAAPAPKKKKKKTGLIIAIVLILVLAIGGGVGYYLYSQYQANVAAYDEAAALLEARDYEGALAAFQELGDFQDAADQAAELEELQADYDAAKALLEEHKFDEAAEAFTELGDYRDSPNYVSSEITYQKALYLKSFADTRDASGLTVAFGGDSVDTGLDLAEDEAAAYLLYGEAAKLFDGLGEYADAVTLASECRRETAMILLSAEYYEDALALCDKMSEADAAAVNDAYLGNCADSQFLKDIVEAFVAWYDDAGKYSFGEEIENAYEIVEPYTTQYFDSTVLKGYLADFIDALGVMEDACSEDDVADWVAYYEGMAKLYATADKLYHDFGVFADNIDLVDTFVGYTELTATYPIIEKSLTNWYDALSEVSYDEEGNCYVSYTNDTSYGFTLNVIENFYDETDTWIDDSETIEIYVAPGATVYIPVKPAAIADTDWSSCDLYWWFSVEN